MNTNNSSVVKQSGNDVEGCRSQKVLFQPNVHVFLQHSVKLRALLTVDLDTDPTYEHTTEKAVVGVSPLSALISDQMECGR